jgi:uncharacterized protein
VGQEPSPALKALYEGSRDRAEELLPPDSELSVFEAAAFGRLAALAAILDADPTQANAWSPDGFTPLHLACFSGGATTSGLLVERGADLEAISRASFAQVRPLGTAAFSGDVASAKVLLEAGADPNGEGRGGTNALQTAEQNGNEELIELLKSFGADAGSAGVGK